MEDCSLHHDCETAHYHDPANDEYNRRHMEELKNLSPNDFMTKYVNDFTEAHYKWIDEELLSVMTPFEKTLLKILPWRVLRWVLGYSIQIPPVLGSQRVKIWKRGRLVHVAFKH